MAIGQPRGSRRFRAVASVLIAVMTALTACVPTPPQDPVRSEERLAKLLSDAGALVVDEAEPAGVDFSRSSVVLSGDQLAAMTAQVATGGGYTGHELDVLTALEKPLPPFSYLLAGWARDHDGPGAQAAREVMGERDWTVPDRVLWSDAVLALFVLDMTAEVEDADRGISRAAAWPASSNTVAAWSAASVGALCTGAADFIQRALASVFAAIDAATAAAERELGLVGRILGLGIRLFHQVATGLVEVARGVTTAMLAPVREAIAIVAVLHQVSTALRPWAVAMTANPQSIVMGPSAQTGAVGARVTTRGLPDYPTWVRQCATGLGLTLPDPPGVGSKVQWALAVWPSSIGVSQGEADGTVRPDSTARMTYHVPPETDSECSAASGGIPVDAGVIEVRLTPDRDQLDALGRLADDLIRPTLSKVPAPIRVFVAGVVDSLRAEALTRLKELLTPNATSVVAIALTFHLPTRGDCETVRPRPTVDPDEAFCRSYAAYIAPRLASIEPDAAHLIELAEQWSVEGPATLARLIELAPAIPRAHLERARDLDAQGTTEGSFGVLRELAATVDWAIANCGPPYREVYVRYRPWLE